MIYKIILVFCILNLFFIPSAFAQEIFTAYTDTIEDMEIDGIWSHRVEWKQSTETKMGFSDGTSLVFRIAHDYDNLALLIDHVSREPSGISTDRVLVCFDPNDDKSEKILEDDYCFLLAAGSNNVRTFSGGGEFLRTSYLQNEKNHPKLIGVSGISNEADRYSKMPHISYEFKIPLELISKKSSYGFFVSVFDSSKYKEYSWPDVNYEERFPIIPPPSQWGNLVSPDKSIPEFPVPLFLLSIILISIIIIGKFARGVRLDVFR